MSELKNKPIIVCVASSPLTHMNWSFALKDGFDIHPYSDGRNALSAILALLQNGVKPIVLTTDDGRGILENLDQMNYKLPTVMMTQRSPGELLEDIHCDATVSGSKNQDATLQAIQSAIAAHAARQQPTTAANADVELSKPLVPEEPKRIPGGP